MNIKNTTGSEFRAAVQARDLDGMVAALDPEVRLFSPVAFRPFAGRDAVRELFMNLLEVFQEFRYEDELSGEESHALIFRAVVEGKELQGLDYMEFGPDGKIAKFTVMVRPASALMALGHVLGPRVGHLAKD
jgi:hypothetical protein